MHREILTKEQERMIPFLKVFSKDFGLVGGTAIALHIGHRESIDFDLFTNKEFLNSTIRSKIRNDGKEIKHVFFDKKDEYTVLVDNVKLTFLFYPFPLSFSEKFDFIKLPDLLTLASMKAYTLGRRNKWKDYVDLYFILRKYHSLKEINNRAEEIFGNEFNEKIFKTQLSYFKDIDYSEKVIFTKDNKVEDGIIKKELISFSIK